MNTSTLSGFNTNIVLDNPTKKVKYNGKLSAFIVNQLLIKDDNNVGLPYKQILENVLSEFPDCTTQLTTVRWYQGAIKSGRYRGDVFLQLPEKRPRARAK
jgi:hypothetical protein